MDTQEQIRLSEAYSDLLEKHGRLQRIVQRMPTIATNYEILKEKYNLLIDDYNKACKECREAKDLKEHYKEQVKILNQERVTHIKVPEGERKDSYIAIKDYNKLRDERNGLANTIKEYKQECITQRWQLKQLTDKSKN